MNFLFLVLGFLGVGSFGPATQGRGARTDDLSDGGGRTPPDPVGAKDDREEPETTGNPREPDDNSDDGGRTPTTGREPDPQPRPEPERQPEPEAEKEPDRNDREQERQPEPEAEKEPEPTPQPKPAPEPEAEKEPEPKQEIPEVANETPEPPKQTGGSDSDGGDVAAQTINGTTTVMTGRVSTLEHPGGDVASIRILSDVKHGQVTVNPDKSLALVLTKTQHTGNDSFKYEVTHNDGSTSVHTAALKVTKGAQDAGWGTGEAHYMLATDEDDRVIVEHGENHTKVFVSGSKDALSLAEIAKMEGMDVSKVTGKWLAQHDEYGRSEDMALDAKAGGELWRAVTPTRSDTSNWLMFERGYEYGAELGRVAVKGASGESELHPLHYGAWGEGDRPELTEFFRFYQEPSSNIVIQDLHFSGGLSSTSAQNILYDNIEATNGAGGSKSEGITYRNSEFHSSWREEPLDKNGDGIWDGEAMKHGMFINFSDGLLLEGNFFDHNGFAPDYLESGSVEGGQPPTKFSHNMYLGAENFDVTVRDMISMRGASTGAQIRSGGFVEDNVFLDNNVAFNVKGGDSYGVGPVGNYSLVSDNLTTSAGYRESAVSPGAKSWGFQNGGEMTSLVDNIVAHLANPDDPSELKWKIKTGDGYETVDSVFYDDTMVHNWQGSGPTYGARLTDANTEDLNAGVLDKTTIQRFTEQLLGKNGATIQDLADYLHASYVDEKGGVVDADAIIEYFQKGFGIDADDRVSSDTLRFIPDDLGDGVRWDNRLNWSTDDLPGTVEGDSVHLGGNHVVFGTNARIDKLTFGKSGDLNVYGGRLIVDEGLVGGNNTHLNIEGAGQVWTDGGKSMDIDVTGGRLANQGYMTNTDLAVTGGEVILGSDNDQWEVSDGKRLEIFDAAAKVGFDGEDGGMAILDLDEGGTLAFTADDGDLGTIGEFRSGTMDDSPDVLSGIDLEGATLEIDLAGLSGTGSKFTLMTADEIGGSLADTQISGLGSRDATVQVNYKTDTVTLSLSKGTGKVSVETVGGANSVAGAHDALWDALTSDHGVADESTPVFDDDGEDLLVA